MTPSHRAIVALLVLVVGVAWGSARALAEPVEVDLGEERRRAAALLARGDYEGARPVLERVASLDPGDFSARYNLACVLVRAGDLAGAEASLRAAIGVGFVDFAHMLRDPDLAPLRGAEVFGTVLRDWASILDVRGEADLRAAREALGPRYLHIRDDELRIHILSAFGERATRDAHDELRRVARFISREVFEIEAPPERPDPWTLVVLPTREHFARFVPFEGVGGVYDHDRRTLATRDLGPSLRHEFVHVLHHRRMMRLGQRHAFWLQEGLASLPERVERVSAESPDIAPAPNWRMNIARRLAEPRLLTPWERLFSLDASRFVSSRPLAMYAQAYAAMFMLYERGELRRWFEAYERGFDEEPTGIGAFVETLGMPPASAQRAFRDWAATRPPVAESFTQGAPSLGVTLMDSGSQEGATVTAVFVRMTGPAANPLRPRDIVLSIDGAPARTLGEAVQALEGRLVGERVRVEVRRGRLTLEVEVELAPYDDRTGRGGAGIFATPTRVP